MITTSPVIRVEEGHPSYLKDKIVLERPLQMKLSYRKGSHTITKGLGITMCTPGQHDELLRGFLYHESVIDHAKDLDSITIDTNDDHDVVSAHIHFDISKRLEGIERSGYRNASCGFCGTDQLKNHSQSNSFQPTETITPQLIEQISDTLFSFQSTFKETGGLHAAALFSPDGEMIALREDIGRHNALDKLTGTLLLEKDISFEKSLLFLSGRVSYEMIEKASRIKVPYVIAVGAPSSLAINLAYFHGITLVGFSKESRFNIYTYPERITTKHSHHE